MVREVYQHPPPPSPELPFSRAEVPTMKGHIRPLSELVCSGRASGFRGLGFRGLGFRGLGFRV